MKTQKNNSAIAALALMAALLVPSLAWAQDETAEEALKRTTTEVLTVIEEAADYVKDDPERYYARVNDVLDDIMDFRGFARGVMGDYASGERYRNLNEEEREELRVQLDRFTDAMREGLVQAYSRGLLAFGGSRVELDEERSQGSSDGNPDRASLRQLIYADGSDPYVVVYQMARNRDGKWLIRNLIVENVNLGQIYRSQFEASARKFKGDLDKVISDWEIEPVEELEGETEA